MKKILLALMITLPLITSTFSAEGQEETKVEGKKKPLFPQEKVLTSTLTEDQKLLKEFLNVNISLKVSKTKIDAQKEIPLQ